jgi:hypothetical protein
MSYFSVGAADYPVPNKPRGATTAGFLLVVTSTAMFHAPAWSQEAARCHAGEEACPAVLRMRPGADVVEATGWVSAQHPNYYFKFDARAGQKLTLRVTGGGIKTGPGIPITMPSGGSDAVDVGEPFALPQTGTYVIVMHANTMSDGPFGRFHLTVRID